MTELEQKIIHCATSYYLGTPEVSDKEFNDLVKQLEESNPSSDCLSTPGYGSRVEPIYGVKRQHGYNLVPSTLLEDTETQLPGQKIISPRLDGIPCIAYVKQGWIYCVLTLGENGTGIDITLKVYQTIKEAVIDKTFSGAILGELIMPTDTWEVIRKIDNSPTPRASAASIINRKLVSDDLKYIDFIPCDIVACEEPTRFKNKLDAFDFLSRNFGNCIQYVITENLTADLERDCFRMFSEKYDCLGLVVTAADGDAFDSNGKITHQQYFCQVDFSSAEPTTKQEEAPSSEEFSSSQEHEDFLRWIGVLGNVDGIAEALKVSFFNDLGIYTIDDLYSPAINHHFTAKGVRADNFRKVLNKLLKEPISAVDALKALNISKLTVAVAKKLAKKELVNKFAFGEPEEWQDDLNALVGPTVYQDIVDNREKFINLAYVIDRLVYLA